MADKANTTTTTKPTTDTSAWQSAGRNVKFTTIENMLFIAVAIDDRTIAASPVSGSGKSKSVGSTLGNVAIPGLPTKFGVNVYNPVTPVTAA